MKIENYISPEAIEYLKLAIEEADGNEVFFVGKTNDLQVVEEVSVIARGNNFAVPMVRIMMQSGNESAFNSMPLVMAEAMTNIFRGAWPLVDSFVGALGSFMAGSNTVSNMLFSVFQYSIAEQLEISRIIIVALTNIGGAIGNMICVHNIIAATATVGLIGVGGILIKRNLIPMSIYGLTVGITGLILVYFVVPGLF